MSESLEIKDQDKESSQQLSSPSLGNNNRSPLEDQHKERDADNNNKSGRDSCNFWELINDVAKDLDLALGDLTPDFDLHDDLIDLQLSDGNRGSLNNVSTCSRSESTSAVSIDSVGLQSPENGPEPDSEPVSESLAERGCSLLLEQLTGGPPELAPGTGACANRAPAPRRSSETDLYLRPNNEIAASQAQSYSVQLLMAMGSASSLPAAASPSCSAPSSDNSLSNHSFSNNIIKPSESSAFSLVAASRKQAEENSEPSLFDDNETSELSATSSVDSIPASIGLLERLIRSHPIWFLPEIGRSGVVHLLQGKEPGCFIVRQSSKPGTMALSVRLPEGRGPHIEHYLIEDGGGGGRFHLEGSENYFTAVPVLVAHYSQCSDELPVQLSLVKVLGEANRQQLTSLSLLGQDFWQSTLSRTPAAAGSGSNSSSPHCSLSKASSQSNSASGSKVDVKRRSEPSAKTSSPPPPSLPPPVPPKLDVTDLVSGAQGDPLVDTKKSSAVPVAIVTGHIQVPPKPPPRTVLHLQQPPVPPRASKPKLSHPPSSTSTSSCSNNNNIMVTTTLSVNLNNSSIEVQPKAEVTLIDIMNDNSLETTSITNGIEFINGTSTGSNNPFSSQLTDLMMSSPNSVTSSPFSDELLLSDHPYYNKSNLEDKFSDYEDIWSYKPVVGFIDSGKKTVIQIKEHKPRNRRCAVASICTQTEHLEKKDIDLKNIERQIPSPFYNEPVDAIKPRVKGKDPRFGSDPHLTLASTKSSKSSHMSQSLESLLDNLRTSLNGQESRDYCLQVLNPKNPKMGDVCIQVGNGKMKRRKKKRDESPCPSLSSNLTTTTKTGEGSESRDGRESSWPVDSSWEWQSSDEANLDRDPELNSEGQGGPCSSGLQDDDGKSLTLPVPASRRRMKKKEKRTDEESLHPVQDKQPKKESEEGQRLDYRRLSYSYNYAVEESDAEAVTEGGNGEKEKIITVEEIICSQAPELKVPKLEGAEARHEPGLSYDSLVQLRHRNGFEDKSDRMDVDKDDLEKKHSAGTATDTETVFSEPWDSEFWVGLLHQVFPGGQSDSFMGLSPDGPEEGRRKSLGCQRRSWKSQPNQDTAANQRQSGISEGVSSTDPKSSEGSVTSGNDGSKMTSTVDISITEVTSFNSDLLSTTSMKEQTRVVSLLSEASSNCNGIGTNGSQRSRSQQIGKSICEYIFKLIEEGDNTFAKSVAHFIQCTKESQELDPKIVTRNIRQFMSGMKNYLVKNGEKELLNLVQEERNKLKSDEFLNIDAIIEGTLHKLVIKPLKTHLYKLFVDDYTRNGSLTVLSKSMKEAQSKSPLEMGVRPELDLPDASSMALVERFLNKLQTAYSPLKKLEYLLAAISIIYNNVKKNSSLNRRESVAADSEIFVGSVNSLKSSHFSFGADDFLPIFIYVLVKCGMLSAEIEADYMWGLLHPSLLSGEGGYYLTTLSSCVHVLKNMNDQKENGKAPESGGKHNEETNSNGQETADSSSPASISPQVDANGDPTGSNKSVLGSGNISNCGSGAQPPSTPCSSGRLPSVADLQGYMKIMIPDELSSSIISKTLPVRPYMTTKQVCKMIAHKFKITNAEDYGLFRVDSQGKETQLGDCELPQTIKAETLASGKEIFFAYKRWEARFVWPLVLK